MKDKEMDKAIPACFIYSDEQIKRWECIPVASKIRLIEGARLLTVLAQSDEQAEVREAFRKGKLSRKHK